MTQSYKYRISESIIGCANDEYELSQTEYASLYSFFVTYSMCDRQSFKKRSFIDYGWKTNSIQVVDVVDKKKIVTNLGEALVSVIDFSKNSNFIFTREDNLNELFKNNNLADGMLNNYDIERCVISKTPGSNRYLKLFHRIRNGLAHGKFLLKLSSTNEKMVVIQDDDGTNVTARLVLRLSTLLRFICIIDIKKLIEFEPYTQ